MCGGDCTAQKLNKMPKFKIKETEKVMMSYIYEVEAPSAEAALDLYTDELAGSLEPINEFQEDSSAVAMVAVVD